MAFKPTNVRQMAIDPTDGKPINYVEGTHHDGDTLPTDHIYQGSYSLNLDNGKVSFFGGTSWGGN